MRTVDLNSTEFFGNTSRPGTSLSIDNSCQRCGSSLAGRFEGTRTIAGHTMLVWRCRCGRARQLRRATR
jgi:hypothetical protein